MNNWSWYTPMLYYYCVPLSLNFFVHTKVYNFYVTNIVDNTWTQFHFSRSFRAYILQIRFPGFIFYFSFLCGTSKRTKWNFYFEIIFFDYFYAFFSEYEMIVKASKTLNSLYEIGNFFSKHSNFNRKNNC